MSEDLAKINEALVQENDSLKGVVGGLRAEKQALEQTVMDLLKANIALKSGTILFENEVNRLKISLTDLERRVSELSGVVLD